MHAHRAPAAGRMSARGCLGAGDAALRGAACGGLSPGVSGDLAGADQQRPHRRPDRAPHRRGPAHGAAERFHVACAAAAAASALADGQPRVLGAARRAAHRRGPCPARTAGLHPAGKPERLAAAPRGRLDLSGHAHAGHVQRRDPAPPGAARRGHRLPVGFRVARRSARRQAGAHHGRPAHRLPAADARGVLPQHAAIAAHRLFPGFFRQSLVKRGAPRGR